MRLGSGLIRLLAATLGRSCRLDLGEQTELERALPAQLTFWHEHAFLAAIWLRRTLIRRRVPLVLLSSPSRDGDLSANLARAWGVENVRASASRGGVEGLRVLRRVVRTDGASPIITPDGPRGPARVLAGRALQLPRLAGIPVLPIGFGCRSAWRLGTWDRMWVPKPGTLISVRFGAPRAIPRRLDDEELGRLAAELGDELDRLSEGTREAAAAGSGGRVAC